MNFNITFDLIQSLYKLKEAAIELSQYDNLVSGNVSAPEEQTLARKVVKPGEFRHVGN